jgi:uncharacterized coiled-coil DUF342 family protein
LKINKIKILASLFDENGKAIQTADLALQFYNAESNKWTASMQKLSVKEGILAGELDFSKQNTNAYSFYESASEGNIPVCRLIVFGSIKSSITEIVSSAFRISFVNNELILNFGNNYKIFGIDEDLIIDKNELTRKVYTDLPLNAFIDEIKELKKQIEVLNRVVENDRGTIHNLNDKLNDAAKNIKILNESILSLEKEKSQLVNEILKYQKQADDIKTKYNKILESLESRVNILTLENKSQGKTISENNEKISGLNELVRTKTEDLQLKEAKINNLNLDIDRLNEKIVEIQKKNPEYLPKSQPVSKVYGGLLDEFKKVKDLNSDNPYKLSNISVNLKTFVEHDENGIRLQLVDANKLSTLNPDLLSVVKVELGDAETETNNKVRVPNLAGLTETAARKILNSLGLQLKAIYEYRNDIPEGQAFKQSPAAGDVSSNETITLIFSKK